MNAAMSPAHSPSPADRPWLASYREAGIVTELPPLLHASLAAMVHERCQYFAAQNPKRPAFTCVAPNGMNGSLSFAEVDALSDAFAAYLRQVLGLQAGDRVAVQLPNSLSYPVVAFGVFKAACVLVNTNPLYTEAEMVHQFNDANVRALVLVDMFAHKLPGVLQKTGLKHVVLAGVPEFFPVIPRAIIRLVQKVWYKTLPPVTVPHLRLRDALAQGQATLAKTPARTYWQDLTPDQLALLQYTGGTTGVSKGTMLSHSNLLRNVQQIRAMGASHIEDGRECVLTALPLYHIFAFTTNLLGFIASGARNILIPNPRPVQNLQRAVENYPLTWITGVNTLFNGLLNEEWFVAYPPRKLKASIAGGAALHAAVGKRWREVTGTPIAEGYGLTETAPVVSFNPLQGKQREGIGIPAPGTELRLVDDNGRDVADGGPGEIWIRGPQVMLGYWNSPAETALMLHDGWLASGDVAVMDADGFLRIVDRKKDVILVSGFNVYPNEIEDVIAQLDSVQEAAVIGVPDEHSGEVVRAYVVPHPAHADNFDVQAVLAHCKTMLTGYKVPKSVLIRTELPKSPIGKVLRKNLKAEVRAAVQAGQKP